MAATQSHLVVSLQMAAMRPHHGPLLGRCVSLSGFRVVREDVVSLSCPVPLSYDPSWYGWPHGSLSLFGSCPRLYLRISWMSLWRVAVVLEHVGLEDFSSAGRR